MILQQTDPDSSFKGDSIAKRSKGQEVKRLRDQELKRLEIRGACFVFLTYKLQALNTNHEPVIKQ